MFGFVRAKPLEDRLATLESQVGQHREALREIRTISAEWGAMYDKFDGLLKRWQKRDRDEARVARTEEPNGPAPAPLNPLAARLLQRGEQ